jgi:hypothetical protein
MIEFIPLGEIMQALTFWKTITMDRSNLLEEFFALLKEHEIRFCVIGGQAVNAYAEPLVGLDLDLVVAVDQLEKIESLLGAHFDIKRSLHHMNITMPESDLGIQIQTDERYNSFVESSVEKSNLGLSLPVASVEDVFQGKIWAALDPDRRGSKRQKDLADIARIIENYPELRPRVPPELTSRLFG